MEFRYRIAFDGYHAFRADGTALDEEIEYLLSRGVPLSEIKITLEEVK